MAVSRILFLSVALSLLVFYQENSSHFCLSKLRCLFPQLRETIGLHWDFPFDPAGSSAGKESACNARDPSSIPRSGRSPGEGISYPLQYSWVSLVAQLVKNLPAMQKTLVQSLGWEDLLEKGVATHSSILACKIPWTVYSMGSQRVGHN